MLRACFCKMFCGYGAGSDEARSAILPFKCIGVGVFVAGILFCL